VLDMLLWDASPFPQGEWDDRNDDAIEKNILFPSTSSTRWSGPLADGENGDANGRRDEPF